MKLRHKSCFPLPRPLLWVLSTLNILKETQSQRITIYNQSRIQDLSMPAPFPTPNSSEMASFEKELTETDINEMLVIPPHFMNNLPANDGGRSVNVTVDASGVQRTFGYYIRRDGNRRPVFRTGWRNYVRDKGLRAGDRIIFECVNGFPRYRIRAQRQMFLFGEEMWGDI